jgi:hypothetical protein
MDKNKAKKRGYGFPDNFLERQVHLKGRFTQRAQSQGAQGAKKYGLTLCVLCEIPLRLCVKQYNYMTMRQNL